MTNQAHAQNNPDQVKVLGHIELNASHYTRHLNNRTEDGDYLTNLARSPWETKLIERETQRVLSEISELQSENRWDDINALFYPLEEKLPEICAAGMESTIRQETAFSLCRAGRHQDSIRCITPLVEKEPENVMAHYTLAYTALDLLFAARAKRQLLTPARKREMTGLAHKHFRKAQELRPDSVTFFYREGILYKEIEDKPRKAVPLFQKAVANWDRLSEAEQKERHQQRPKFVRSLYHLASSFLKLGMASRSLELIKRVMEEDRDRDHISPVFKHFACAKVLHSLGRAREALDHLDTAAYRANKNEPVEYVFELAARCCLQSGNVERALEYIEKIAPNRRRPYVQWTHADVLAATGREAEALKLLAASAERDRRTRHIALIRTARLHFAQGNMEAALEAASGAAEFCRECFGNPSNEALFWEAAALHGLKRDIEALDILEDLAARRFQYPNLGRLLREVRSAAQNQRKSQNNKRPDISLVI